MRACLTAWKSDVLIPDFPVPLTSFYPNPLRNKGGVRHNCESDFLLVMNCVLLYYDL